VKILQIPVPVAGPAPPINVPALAVQQPLPRHEPLRPKPSLLVRALTAAFGLIFAISISVGIFLAARTAAPAATESSLAPTVATESALSTTGATEYELSFTEFTQRQTQVERRLQEYISKTIAVRSC
jgi:hypothetical protein